MGYASDAHIIEITTLTGVFYTFLCKFGLYED